MKYKIAFKKSVSKDLKNIGKEQSKRILNKIEKELPLAANKYSELKGRFKGLRKVRVGDYRIVYTVIKDIVLIVRVGHRKEIYGKK